MPGNLFASSVASGTVLPKLLCTSFVESQPYPYLQNSYHDGSIQSSLITDGVNSPRPARTWQLSARLEESELAALLSFWESVNGGHSPFYFYDPFAASPVGSNWDGTGVSTTGRVTVVFRGDWSHSTGLGRSVVPNLQLVEIA